MTGAPVRGRFPEPIARRVAALVAEFAGRGVTIATAESCTGGLIAGCITDVPGSSAVLERGIVAYSNEAKRELLGVPAALLEAHGAVSAEVAEAMATGAIAASRAKLAVAVTGIAGPSGGSAQKPVGLVFTAVASRNGTVAVSRRVYPGDRDAVRLATVADALERLAAAAKALP